MSAMVNQIVFDAVVLRFAVRPRFAVGLEREAKGHGHFSPLYPWVGVVTVDQYK